MNFHDLDNFNLADAVKFHQRLNPRLWGSDEHLLPDVRDKLLAIASNFQEFLGVDDLNIQDITISGSNAAYSYTRHSDIDLHLVVDMPDDPVYQELFNAKKYQYNAEHDIKIAGVPVELYVQPSDQKHVSQGIYSVKNGDWVQVPQRRRASIDDSCVQHKTADLDARIHSAIKSGNADAVNQLWDKIKTMRQTGLEKNGEFGCENIAFKLLRNMGCIGKLKDAKTAIQDRELSLNRKPAARKKVNYGMRDYWYPGTAYAGQDHPAGTESEQVDESVELDHLKKILHRFYASCVDKLKLENPPRLRLETTPEWSQENGSFGQYEPESNTLILATAGRHVLDILRTMAHEMTHRQQDERNPLPIDAGETGSPWEDQANAMAGRIMRQWAEEQPEMFDGVTLEEASGYIPTKAQARDPRFVMALTRDVRPGAVGKEANKLGLQTDSQGHPALLTAGLNKMLREFKEKDLFEIKMTSTNLRQLAAQTGAQAGMEFEMIVPDVGVDEQEPDWEPDYDQDQRTRSFSDIRDFFHDGDHNGRRAVDDLMEEIQNEYEEWQQEQTAEAWTRDGVDYMRDFVNVNDLFDRDEAMLQARDEIMDANPDLPQESEDFSQLLSARLDELQEQFVLEAFEDQGRVFNDAFEAFAEEQRDEYDEGSFLDDKYQTMSDIESNFDIEWPYYTDANEGNDGDMDIDQVADEFSSYMGKPVNASRNYHGGRREAGTYVVEPDGSLEGDNPGDEGLEFVSPPMPIDEMISDLNKVKAWADKSGCYTNDSTGLHINISVPNYSLDKLDYVKLALLMGDEYVLELFGRSGNNYAKSAIGKIKTMLKRNPDIAPQVMDKMREHMEDIATKAIHTGTTEKYTSINTKTGYIEFRSPGGDWLDSNFSKIEDTLLRFTVALDAAMDPEKYRQEYLKKLYKLLNPNGTKDEYGDMIQEFAKYMVSLQGNSKEVGDKLSKETQQAIKDFRKATFQELEQQNLARNLAKGKTPKGQKYWWDVSRPGYFASIEIVASSKEEAIAKAIEPGNYPDWASARNTLQAKPLRPYQDPKPSLSYSVYDARAGYNRSSITASSQEDAVQKFRQFVSGENNPHDFSLVDRAGTVVARGGDQQQPGPQSAAQPSTGNWGIWMNDMNRFARAPGQSDNNVLRRFPSREAAEQFITQGREQNSRMITDIEVREIEPQQTEQPIWYVSPQGNPGQEIQIRASSELNAIRAAGEARPDIFGNTAGRSHLFRASTVPARSSNAFVSTQNVPREGQPRNLVPTGPGPWEIYRISDNSTVRELSNTSRPEAEQEARLALGMRGEAPELYGVRTRQGNNSDAAQGGIVDVGIPQTLTRPGQGQQTFTGNWLILNPDGQEIHRFSGVGNVQSDANRVAINWMRSNPGRMQAGVTVVPEMGVAASQQQYQYTSTPIPGVEDVELDIPMAQTQWEVYNRSSNQPVFVIQAANQTEAWRRGQEWVATAMQANPEVDASNFSVRLRSQSVSENITVLEQRLRRDLDALGNQKPTGPETPPKMPAGTIKVDVSDTQDWYQLGQDISDLDQADKSHYNQGPPHTVLAFGSEELENMYSHKLKRLGLPIHDLDEPGEEDMDESQEITKLGKLDNVLKKCINMIHRGHETDPEKYGRVAACLIDNKNNHTYAINLPGLNGTRRHAERVAIDQHLKRHGRIGPNAIMVTTLSPCVHDMDERYGESCTDLLADFGIEKCYAGWQDPTQHPTTDYPFNLQVTDNADIFNTCQHIAASFLPQVMANNLNETINPDVFNPAFNDTQIFDGLTYRATGIEINGKEYFQVKVLDDNYQQIGLAKFRPSKNGLVSAVTSLKLEYQGRGIARNIYAYVRMLGNTIVPSRNQLPPGKAMWDAWKKSGDAKHLMKDVAEEEEPIRIKLGNNDAAQAWIERVYAKYPYTMQNNHVMVWGKGDDQQFAMFELVPSFSKRGAVEVKWIQAYPLRQGVGSRAMQELQAMAREDGISLTLFPWDKGQVSQSKLTKFYRGQGFTPTVKGSKSMQWEPK